jgi:multisubunit Na+/H+ antiporter MnhC subunit
MDSLLVFLFGISLFVISVAITAVALKYAISIQNKTTTSDSNVNDYLQADVLSADQKNEETDQ